MTHPDHAGDAQRAAEEWLAELDTVLYDELEAEGSDEVEWPDRLLAPYDGCDTCRVRETLAAAAPHLFRLALELLEDQGKVTRADRENFEKALPTT